MLTGAQLAVQALEEQGVEVAFGLPGVHNLALWRAVGESGIRLVGVRHEQTAAYAPDGYARARGRLGVALTTTGPGAANTPPALGEGQAAERIAPSRRPLIWAGGGALQAGAGQAVAQLAERLVAPVITTYSARGLLPADHPCLVADSPHVPEVGGLWDEADLVIAIGTDLDGPMTLNWTMPPPPPPT